jgi:hypothetical protein
MDPREILFQEKEGAERSKDASLAVRVSVRAHSQGTSRGIQPGLIIKKAGEMTGIRFGAVNYAKEVSGFQLGLVNICENLMDCR